MMAGQSKLPKLPIPTLEDTCKRYLEQVAPLLSAAGLERTRGAVAQFLAGDGPKLQAALHEYASDKTSYVEDYWFESYLDYDASVVLNVNPFFVLADDPMPCASDMQISRAASLVISAVQFAIKLRTGELQPDTWRGSALCMQQYNYLFACARMPSEDGHDHIERHEHSQHIVVLCHGLAYYFDVLWPEGTELCLSEAQLSDNLRRIRTDADAVVAGASAEDALGGRVGVLTTDLRCEWAAARDELARSPTNLELLHVVDSALFVLCLDDDAPSEPGKVACAMLHGSYNLRDGVQCGSMTNRWYDKLQIIVCANGTAGVNFEHTRVDGHTVLRFVSDVFAETIMRFAAKISAGIDPRSLSADPTRLARRESSGTICQLQSKELGAASPRLGRSRSADAEPNSWPYRLEWQVPPNSRLRQRIHFAEVRLSDLVSQHDTRSLELDDFGKMAITQLDASPDGFVQLAIMAAYFALYGQVVCVYEPVQTKTFLHGRTEAARTMTVDAARFVRAWTTDAGDDAKEGRLRAALRSLSGVQRAAAAGQGVDRHLFALLKTWERSTPKGTPPPSLFGDKAWAKLNHTILSTSNCGNPALRLFGFGPVVENGFGIGYIIKDYRLSFCASSKHRQTARFLQTLERTLHEMRQLLARVHARKKVRALDDGAEYGFFCDGRELGDSEPGATSHRDGAAHASQLGGAHHADGTPRPGKRVRF